MKQGLLAITFDDGFKTDLTVGLQEQLNRGMEPKGTSYIISSYTGANRLTNEDKLTLVNHGWDLQCHSHTHPLGGPGGGMTGLTAEELRQEMQNVNKHFVEDLGLPPPEHHSLPGGAYNKLILDVIGKYRKTMRTTTKRFFRNNINGAVLTLGDEENFRQTIDICMKYGVYAILLFHELDTEEKVDHYKAVLDYVQETGIRLVTISELYRILR